MNFDKYSMTDMIVHVRYTNFTSPDGRVLHKGDQGDMIFFYSGK